MKIILTTNSPNLESEVDPRFGRSPYLLVVDTESLEWQALPNAGAGAHGGAGVQAAQFVVNQKAEAVLSGEFGPQAFSALQAAGVAMALYGDCLTARQAIERFKAGELKQGGWPGRGVGHGNPLGKDL